MATDLLAVKHLSIWKRRYEAIDALIQDAVNRAPKASNGLGLQIEVFADLLARLRAFGSGQFDYFIRGLTGDGYTFPELHPAKLNAGRSVPPRRLTQEMPDVPWTRDMVASHMLARTLDRISADLVVIENVLDQRLRIPPTENGPIAPTEDNPKTRLLRQADLLAQDALSWMDVHFDRTQNGNGRVLTYLRSSLAARVIPYADVTLIGIPLTSIAVREDLLAIPHEVGHYFYWNGESDGQQYYVLLAQKQAIQDNPVAAWTEEVFADIVCALIGGPFAAYSFMQLMETFVGSDFLYDDGEHPIPAIRPFLFFELMATSSQLWEDSDVVKRLASDLKTLWGEVLKKRFGHTNLCEIPLNFRDGEISLERRRLDLLDLVKKIQCSIDFSTQTQRLLEASSANFWRELHRSGLSGDGAPITIEQLFAHFGRLCEAAASPEQASANLTQVAVTGPDTWESIVAKAFSIQESLPGEDFSAQLASEYPWTEILDFKGWTVAGPVGRPHD